MTNRIKIKQHTGRIRRSLSRAGLALGLSLSIAAAGCAEGKDEAQMKEAPYSSEEGTPSYVHSPASVESGESAADSGVARAIDRKVSVDVAEPMVEPVFEPGDTFTDHGVNPWTQTVEDALSTFAVDVDTASYTIARRMLESGRLPPAAAVRVEEFVNHFDYGYKAPAPGSQMPFEVDLEAAPSPFEAGTTLLRVGVQGQAISPQTRKPAHLTFLVDVSGSMTSADKLGLARQALGLLVEQLEPHDTVALVTYAGSTRVVLEPTPVSERWRILGALGSLSAGGSTAMGSGLQLAYEQAMATHEPGAVNRVIVVSDGDANVGSTDHGNMLESINHYVAEGITLSTIGVGMGNYRDTTMEQLANRGNGNNYYFDSMEQARRIFVDKLAGTLQVIARDVKIQVDFDPAVVAEYRLVGYENRDIADDDFRDDKVDAGEIGAGHSVTALYELRLQPDASAQASLATVRIRHESPDGPVDAAPALEHSYQLAVGSLQPRFEDASDDLRFAVAVAAFAERLRHSPARAQLDFETLAEMAAAAAAGDPERKAFVGLVQLAGDAK